MTIAFYCVLIVSFLPIVWVAVAKRKAGFRVKHNANPRELLAGADGIAKRANWAQANAWESLTPFAAAVIIASIVGVEQTKLDIAAVIFTTARILHGIFYITDKHQMRSIVWFLSILCIFYLYFQAGS